MAAKKYLRNLLGRITEVAAVVTSAGAANDGDLVALDATGKLDASVMPSGFGQNTASIQASEALSAGDLVNIHNSTGARVRKADATSAGKETHGFVLAAVANGATATSARSVYFSFVTLATVGYGDYTAATNLGHTLSITEALLGQIYLVTVVATIVSRLGPRRAAT